MDNTLQQKNTKLIWTLIAVVIGMFAFATLIMPPLYDAFCDWTGLNGKVELKSAAAPEVKSDNPYLVSTETAEAQAALAETTPAVAAREVRVQFIAKADRSIPWDFKPVNNGINVVPGKASNIQFEVTNLTKTGMTGRAVPSVTPAQATPYLRKMECFCFQEQHLEAGQTKLMPLQFYFTEELPEDIKEVTLSYTLYNMEKKNGSTN